MSANGPSRHFAALQTLVAFGCIADAGKSSARLIYRFMV